MQGWQVATIEIIIGLSLIGISLFRLRPRAKIKPQSAYRRWKLLFIMALIITVIGVIELFVPENFWWG